MRKLFFATLFTAFAFSLALAQDTQPGDIPNMGRAPSEPDGIGRLDARVVDEAGNPVRGVYIKLESRRVNDQFCEAWNTTDARGVAVLPAIHMGQLRLIVKAKGYEDQKLDINASSLGEPVRITLKKDD
jgi:hypothetical protein